jgi:hypothetical protein
MTFTSPSVTVSRDLAVLPLQVRFRTATAGSRPPLLITTLVMRNEFAFRCQCVATPTAGLRPPLFVGVRLCIAKIVFSPANVRTATQERGA